MSGSLSRGRVLDVGDIGLTRDDLPPAGAAPDESRFDPRKWWPEDRRGLPLELEIGCGKGTFLVQEAPLRPDVNYLGIEYAREYWRYAADRVRRHGLPNVRLLYADAAEFIVWHCTDAVLARVHIYFPDPWPKKRHHKRRLINETFLRELHRTLADGGLVRIVTDHDEYFAWIEDHAARVGNLFERMPLEHPGNEGEMVGTNFERKYRQEGRPFHALSLAKR